MSADSAAIRQRSEAWMSAWIAKDRATLESLMTEDYSLVIASAPGERFERDRWLDLAVGAYVCTRFNYRDVLVRQVADDMAVMSSVGDFEATISGTDRSGEFFLTDVWRCDGGEWKVCARFSSPLYDDSSSIGEMRS